MSTTTKASTKIAFLGPAGTFTEAAMQQLSVHFEQVEPLPVSSPSEALAAVRAGVADFACVAIENSVDGAVTAAFDALVEGERVQVYREVDLPVVFSIMVRPGMQLGDVATFATHPVAYQQVRGWLKENLPGVKFVPASSNGAAAQAVAQGRLTQRPRPRVRLSSLAWTRLPTASRTSQALPPGLCWLGLLANRLRARGTTRPR